MNQLLGERDLIVAQLCELEVPNFSDFSLDEYGPDDDGGDRASGLPMEVEEELDDFMARRAALVGRLKALEEQSPGVVAQGLTADQRSRLKSALSAAEGLVDSMRTERGRIADHIQNIRRARTSKRSVRNYLHVQQRGLLDLVA